MSRPSRYCLRMALFLACVVAGAATLWEPLYKAFFYNPLLNGLIAAILLTGVIWNIVQTLRLSAEVRWVEARKQTRTSLVNNKPPPLLTPLATAFRLNEYHNGQHTKLPALTVQALLDSVSGRLDEGREISRYLTSLLIFLGLLGTFYGLLLTVASIADVISGMSVNGNALDAMFEQLKTNLAKPLHGMSTAFSGSLFGLASALIVGFLDLTAGQANNRFFNELEEWLTEQTIYTNTTPAAAATTTVAADPAPAYTQALLEQTAENLTALQQIIRSSEAKREYEMTQLVRLTEQMSRSAGQADILRSIEQRLEQIIQNNHDGRVQMTNELKDSLRVLARIKSTDGITSDQEKH
ncbi:flagellar motor protein MotA [Acetobacter thailandicus]|uniref:flagellar motor protein MotA n=1 Tax=Acetobacter thailandicus TaxID=1502842 RepID=UPI001BAB3D1A|nr:flagellar motor protein MotA [Acetobacter thailandicus]MBS0985059.1 flagellar motor protein MotA [Acetobacter thailandicus]